MQRPLPFGSSIMESMIASERERSVNTVDPNGGMMSAYTRAAAALRDAARSNPFVVPLEGAAGWYRWHRLLADALRAELRVHQPELEPELHRRASAWHEAQGEPAKAIEHARAAGDARRAAELVWTNLAPRLEHGDPASFGNSLQEFRRDPVPRR